LIIIFIKLKQLLIEILYEELQRIKDLKTGKAITETFTGIANADTPNP